MKLTVANVILNLFRDNFAEGPFKFFRIGDPISFAESLLPALFISESETAYGFGPTGHDEITHRLTIQVVYNKKDEVGNPKEGASLDETMDALIQGRDETSGDFLSNTILGVLRRNITLGSLAINSQSTVRKGVIPRSENLLTAEAHIDIVVTELQSIANRV